MRTILVLCLALMIALSFGCSKKGKASKEAEARKAAQQTERPKAGTVIQSFDVVSKTDHDYVTSPYSYEYNGVLYLFESAENMEAFKADPTKYVNPDGTPAGTPPQGQ